MSDFVKNEEMNFQAEVRVKIERLRESLVDKYCRWDDWELRFIRSQVRKLDFHTIVVSTKEYTKIWDLWERSFR